jgi:hypothetical protein
VKFYCQQIPNQRLKSDNKSRFLCLIIRVLVFKVTNLTFYGSFITINIREYCG